MRNRYRSTLFIVVVLMPVFNLIVPLLPAAAAQDDLAGSRYTNSTSAHYRQSRIVTGGFKIQCSEALCPFMHLLSSDFQRFQPKITVEVKKGTHKAVTEFLQPPLWKTGKIMMMDDRASSFQLLATPHRLSDNEVKEFVVQHGYEPTALPIAVDAVALYVHKDNPLVGLTLNQVDAVFSSTRKRGVETAISQWGQLGLGDRWREAPIQLHGQDRRSEARAIIQEQAFRGGDFKPGVREHAGAATVVLSINRDSVGIGYSGLGLQTSTVRVVPIAEKEGMPFVFPSRETLEDQTYPLGHEIYLYLDKSPKSVVPEAVQEFLRFLMTREGEEATIKAGLFPLPPSQAPNKAMALSTGPVQPLKR